MDTIAIKARLTQIQDSLKLLDEIAVLDFAEFSEDPYKFNTAERQLQVAIQAALDIGQHVLAHLGVDTPQDYADIFAKLAEIKLLPEDLAAQLVKMARFRNILVHLYLQVRLDIVYDILLNNLGDLDEFAAYITQFMQKQEAEEGQIDR